MQIYSRILVKHIHSDIILNYAFDSFHNAASLTTENAWSAFGPFLG